MDKETLIRVVLAAAIIMVMWWAYDAYLAPKPTEPGTKPEEPAPPESPDGETAGEGEVVKPAPGDAAVEVYDLKAAGAPEAAAPVVLGSDLPAGGYDLEAEIHPVGAALTRLTLARRTFFKTVQDRGEPAAEREPMHLVGPGAGEPALAVEELRIRLEGKDGWGKADLAGVPWRVAPADGDGPAAAFEVDVTDADGQPLVTVRREYALAPRAAAGPAGEDEPLPQYELRTAVELRSRDPRVESAYYVLHGPPALPREGQRRDYRRAVVGRWEAGRVEVERYEGKKALGGKTPRIGPDMAWVGQEDKYFCVVAIPLVSSPQGARVIPSAPPGAGTFAAGARLDARTVVQERQEVALPIVRLESKAVPLEPDTPVRHAFVVFAGPKDPHYLEAHYQQIGLDELVVWSQCCIPGMAPISRLLLTIIEAFHSVVGNWGVAIMMLVILLQIVLLPVNRWSAKSMGEMQKMAPKMQEIREKYAGDQKKMQEEMSKIGGFKAFGGCLPMFVQMPVWIGLYGALLVAIQLRHSAFLPAAWIPHGSLFLQDLAAPDMFIHWDKPLYLPGREIPILGWLIGAIQGMLGGGGGITSFNLLPIAVGVLMYVQQKLMPMSSSAAANPQAQQQQKMMMKFMPIFLGVVLYSAPAGLCLYITTSSLVRLVENKFFRHRWIQEAKAGGEKPKEPEAPGEPARRQSLVAGRKKSIGERAEAWVKRKMDEARKQQKRGKGKK